MKKTDYGDLRNCPFCESDDLEPGRIKTGGTVEFFYIFCVTCAGRGPACLTIQGAVDSWNGKFSQK